MPNSSLASLLKFVKEEFLFTQERYPNGDLSTPEKVLAFAVRHSSLHMAKTSGQVAAEAERYDHGSNMDKPALRIATAKMLVNTLKLADELGMTPEDLVFEMERVIHQTA